MTAVSLPETVGSASQRLASSCGTPVFAVGDEFAPVVSLRVGGGVMTSYRFFKMAAIESEVYFRVQV